MALGEKVAIGMPREIRMVYREACDGFSLTLFDGTPALRRAGGPKGR